MKNVESYILQIEDDKAGTGKKDFDRQVEKKEGENQIEEDKDRVEEIKDPDNPPEQGKERDQLQISEKILEEKEVTVPTEYFAINLMNLI